jgi:hypothetical protein
MGNDNLGYIYFDVLLERKADYDSEVTSNPTETGFAISDHVIKKPNKLNITALFTPTPVTWAEYQGGPNENRLLELEQKIKAMRDAGETITVTTPDNIYSDMVLTSISLPRDNKGYSITANLEFTNVIIVDTQTADVPEEYVVLASQVQSQAGATDTDAGTAQTEEITAPTNNTDSTTSGSEATADTSNKSWAASVGDAIFG